MVESSLVMTVDVSLLEECCHVSLISLVAEKGKHYRMLSACNGLAKLRITEMNHL